MAQRGVRGPGWLEWRDLGVGEWGWGQDGQRDIGGAMKSQFAVGFNLQFVFSMRVDWGRQQFQQGESQFELCLRRPLLLFCGEGLVGVKNNLRGRGFNLPSICPVFCLCPLIWDLQPKL